MRRLWHYKMISFLPEAQLLGLWRTCCAIAQERAEDRTIKNPLIKPVMNHTPEDFITYCSMVKRELMARGYEFEDLPLIKMIANFKKILWNEAGENDWKYWDCVLHSAIVMGYPDAVHRGDIFKKWHNHEYFEMCYWNLYELYLCGCIPEEEWDRFVEGGREIV